MTALQGQQRQEKAHGPAASIAHQQRGGLCVGPQIRQQRTNEHRTHRGVRPQLGLICHQERANRHNAHTGRQPVHTIGTVDHIDAGPDQDHDQQQIHRVGQCKLPAQQLHAAAVEIQVGHTCHHRNGQVDQTFFVLVPSFFRCIIQVTGQHRSHQKHRVDQILGAERHKRKADQRNAQHKDQAGATGFALGQLSVHCKRTAMVLGKFITEQRVHQCGQCKCQQQCHCIYTPLPNGRCQHRNHFQYPLSALKFNYTKECITSGWKNQPDKSPQRRPWSSGDSGL